MQYAVKTIAKLFNLSDRRVQQLAKEGHIPKPERGKYDLVGCTQGYIKYLQNLAFTKDITATDYHTEKTRLTKAQADKTELELSEKNQELLPFDDVVQCWQSMVGNARIKILAMPSKITTIAMRDGKAHEIEQAIKALCYETLDELAGDGSPI